MEKVRLFALAKELDVDSHFLITALHEIGVVVKHSPLAGISLEDRDRVISHLIQKGWPETPAFDIHNKTLRCVAHTLASAEFLTEIDFTGLDSLSLARVILEPQLIHFLSKNCGHIIRVELSECKLDDFPEFVRACVHLQQLSIDRCNISMIPDWIGELSSLTVLRLSGNPIAELPSTISRLTRLAELDLTSTSIQMLPRFLSQMPSLARLYLHSVASLDIPEEILGTPRTSLREGSAPPDAERILKYYERMEVEGNVPLREAKLILVGQGGVGKTSLAKQLLGMAFDAKEPQTHGINVKKWKFTTKAKQVASRPPVFRGTKQKRREARRKWKQEHQVADGAEQSLVANIWDFGGQEIMHSTHQFFLSRRSVYVLLIDARAGEQEGNLHYWLRTIRAFGDAAPVVIVVNKCEPPHHLDLDKTRIVLDYAPNVVVFHYVSCSSGEGIDGLRATLAELLTGLPHVSDRVPRSYFRIKRLMEERSRSTDFVTAAEFSAACTAHGVSSQEERCHLLQLLHDLGSVLHYDDPRQLYAIHDTNVLNPEWVTTGVYGVIMNHGLRVVADGKVRMSEISDIINNHGRYPKDRIVFLVGLMQKFDLCFEFHDDPGLLLVPELLGMNEPDVGWVQSRQVMADKRRPAVLDFEIHYGLLPRGLMPRFIVRTHHLLTLRPTYWRNGVVLDIDGCRVLIRGDQRASVVFIQVQGSTPMGRRKALSVVRDHFRVIHAAMPRLGAEEKVPLPSEPDAPPVDYNHLRRLEAAGERTIFPLKAKSSYHVRDLLNGVEDRSFDVFVSHNSVDKPAIRELAKVLRNHHIRPWVDEEVIVGGDSFQDALIEGFDLCQAVMVCIGPNGQGPWQNQELLLAQQAAATLGKRLIPVLLPGLDPGVVPKFPGAWRFLESRSRVDLRAGFDDVDQIHSLIAGIQSDQ